jgi:hypothetical protein
VIGKEVECALKEAMEGTNIIMNLPLPANKSCSGLPYHEWFIEFENEPEDDATLRKLDNAMRKQNMYYDDLIIGNILQKQ